ncbi:hypothetical protein ACQ86N_01180 [Puia sp. P3]|uniref:hypothetical protein n=1 Tax=Puia sp. P3 TaxID=3423952 RepID=UPI003D66F1BC
MLRQIAQYQIVKPKPVLHNQAYFFAEKVDNTRYQTFDLTAAFSGDGSLLAVYDGYSKCRLVQVAGGAIQEFTAGSSAHKLVFNHSGSQLLICQDDSAILVDATSKPAQSSVIFIKNVSGSVKGPHHSAGLGLLA